MAFHVPFPRRRFNVHPIQQKYFFLSLVPLFVFVIVLIILILFPLNTALMGPFPNPDNPGSIWNIHTLMDVRIWLAVLISMLASCLLSYIATNKFAGLLYRIEQILRKGEEGHLPLSVRARRGDDLQEFVELLDGNFRRTSSALIEIKEQQALAVEELTAVQGKVKDGFNEEMILTGLEEVSRYLREVENILANFTLPAGQAPNPESREKERLQVDVSETTPKSP